MMLYVVFGNNWGHVECREIWAGPKIIEHRLAVPRSPSGDIANAGEILICLTFEFLGEIN